MDLRKGNLSWQDFLRAGNPFKRNFRPHVAQGCETCNILFSSGTTGRLQHLTCSIAVAAATAYSDWQQHHCTCQFVGLGDAFGELGNLSHAFVSHAKCVREWSADALQLSGTVVYEVLLLGKIGAAALPGCLRTTLSTLFLP